MVNGDTLHVSDGTMWKSISINGNSYLPEGIKITNMDGKSIRYKFTADTTLKTMTLTPRNSPEAYEFQYEETEKNHFTFHGTSSQGDTISIQTKSKSLLDYPLTANEIRWITDLR